MEALAGALQPAITDLEVSWHLPEGYDVIQTPQLLPFVQNNKRLVIYGILYRPPSEEKESPRTPLKRKMDWSMRSFSNSSVKVFWFEDECDLLADDQFLLEGDEALRLSEDDFEKEEELKHEAVVPGQDSFDTEMENVPEPDTIEAIADGLLKSMCRQFSKEKASDDDQEVTQSFATRENNDDHGSREEDKDRSGLRVDSTEVKEHNNNDLYSTDYKPPNCPIQNDVKSEIDIDSERVDEFHEDQRSPKLVRAYERDSGVGFSMEDSDKSPDEIKKTAA